MIKMTKEKKKEEKDKKNSKSIRNSGDVRIETSLLSERSPCKTKSNRSASVDRPQRKKKEK